MTGDVPCRLLSWVTLRPCLWGGIGLSVCVSYRGQRCCGVSVPVGRQPSTGDCIVAVTSFISLELKRARKHTARCLMSTRAATLWPCVHSLRPPCLQRGDCLRVPLSAPAERPRRNRITASHLNASAPSGALPTDDQPVPVPPLYFGHRPVRANN